jgi:antitoxin component YwqK of YwqJK toxin-antitoxin module
MANDYKDMKKWLTLSEEVIRDSLTTKEEEANDEIYEAESPREKLDADLGDHEAKIMGLKMEHLNMLIKKKYYEKDENIPEEKMFQFSFQDKGDSYAFTMPLVILFNKSTRKYCAQYWDAFFKDAGIDTTFEENITEALKQTTTLHLTMKLNKKMTKEIGEAKIVNISESTDDDNKNGEWTGEKGDSVYKAWHPNGKPRVYSSWKNGVRHGEHMEWDADGKLTKHTKWEKGKLVRDNTDLANENIPDRLKEDTDQANSNRKGEWSGEKKNSVYKAWHSNGQPSVSTSWKNGVRHGHHREWDKEGKLVKHEFYDRGRRVQSTDQANLNQPSKKLKEDTDQANSNRSGEWTGEKGDSVYKAWHLNGQPKISSPYQNGVKHGESKEWDKEGNIVKKEYFNKGEKVGSMDEVDGNWEQPEFKAAYRNRKVDKDAKGEKFSYDNDSTDKAQKNSGKFNW